MNEAKQNWRAAQTRKKYTTVFREKIEEMERIGGAWAATSQYEKTVHAAVKRKIKKCFIYE